MLRRTPAGRKGTALGKDPRVIALQRALNVAEYRNPELKRLARLFREERYAPGAVLCTEGEMGHEAYLIVDGTAQVTMCRRKIRTLGPGEFFGELALLEDAPRSATVRALTPLNVLTVDRERFPSLMADRPTNARVLSAADRYVRRRSRTMPVAVDPSAWKALLHTARCERVRRRRIRLTVTIAVVVVLSLVAGIGIRALADRSTPVTVEEALTRFRETQEAGPLMGSTATEATSSGGGETQQPRPLRASASAAEGSRAANPDVEAAEARPLPGPGVYRYATSGWEEVTLFGGSRHTYPAETTMTITNSPCGMKVRWDPLAERWDEWHACLVGRGAQLERVVTFREFFKVRDHREFSCTPGVYLRPPADEAGTTFGGRCDGTDAGAAVAGTIVGIETVPVEGRPIPAVRVRIDQTLDGASEGTKTDETWYALDTGLVLRHTSRTDAEASTVAGHSAYREDVSLELLSLTPKT